MCTYVCVIRYDGLVVLWCVCLCVDDVMFVLCDVLVCLLKTNRLSLCDLLLLLCVCVVLLLMCVMLCCYCVVVVLLC